MSTLAPTTAPHRSAPPASALQTIEASVGFSYRGKDKLYTYTFKPPEGTPASNVTTYEQTVSIENVRPNADTLSLDVEGFSVVRAHSAVRDFWDEAQTLGLGHPETAELVKAQTGASRVVVFDHTLRRRTGEVDRSPNAPRQPAARLHVDQTVWSGPQRVQDLMGDQAEKLLGSRAAIINVWRPIAHTARDWPLVLGDARSIAADNLLPSDLIFPHRRGEIYLVEHAAAQRWCYVPDLAVDEAILIKCWDSDESVARFAPHSGFDDPTTPPGTPPRESIEFRTLAFFD
jgi:hypothetical protein